jgi:enoyl-CoA hydratase/carnithine racemase
MLDRIDHGPVRELRLNRPPVNAFDEALLAALEAEFRAPPPGVRGLVVSGAPGRFSAGLDVPALLGRDAAGIAAFTRTFFECLAACAECPVPVVSAITGHCPAGGAVLSLYADRRVMARGDFRIGLNEVAVALYPPPVIHRAFERLVGTRVAAEMLATGALVDPERALAVGLVDELAAPEEVVARAVAWLGECLKLPPRTYARTRALVRADLIALMRAPGAFDVEALAREWTSPETVATLAALFAKGGQRARST